MMMCLVALLGVGIGVVTGLLGAGPSILTVLLLIHVAGLALGSAVTTSLVVVAGMSLIGVVPHARAGTIRWQAAAGFGLASMAGAYLGGRVATLIPTGVLMAIFLLSMLAAAASMLWQRPPPVNGGSLTDPQHLAVLFAGGLLVGALTGLVGLGGGFAVVPLLVVMAGMPLLEAVGTSILIIAMNTLAGLAGHLPHLAIDWRIAAYLTVAESAGCLLGARFGRRISAKVLRRAFACLMIVAAVCQLGSTLPR
jgi:uncharacterized membrane protein YfcA